MNPPHQTRLAPGVADFMVQLQAELGRAMTCAGGLPLADQETARRQLRDAAWSAYNEGTAELMRRAMASDKPADVLAEMPRLLRALHLALAVTEGTVTAPATVNVAQR